MEVLDEYDNEFPQSVTFCQLISEEDFERQAATYTERSLRRLFRSLDRNPALAERVVRKGKQTEMEQRGLLSGLWAKFVCAVQGELNQCNSMGALEMHQRLEQLKWRIHRVHLYSRGAKKRRRRRLKPKRAADPVIFRDRSTSPCLPPAPLPPPLPPPPLPVTTMASVVAASPPVYTMPRVFGPFPPLSGKPMEKLDISRSEVKLNWNSLSSTSKSHMVDLTPLVLNPGGFHFSYLAGNNAHKLHCPGFPWTAPSCSEPSSTNETPSPVVKASIFTPPVLLKFQPVPRPKDNSETFQPVPRPKDDSETFQPMPRPKDDSETFQPVPRPKDNSEMFQPVPRPKDDSEKFQPVPRPKEDSENDPGSAESIPAKKSE
ncbi:extensin-like [Microtus oregoni]|uniref:extensin-like n=1 Tax=Microtus oregoni TaxID=111838 RepID=UPI001BB20663|nr:extensin-like [Microtus oregoni]